MQCPYCEAVSLQALRAVIVRSPGVMFQSDGIAPVKVLVNISRVLLGTALVKEE